MKCLVDSTVWSETFKRKGPSSRFAVQLRELILREEALLIGAIRQEVLSGIRSQALFLQLRDRLRAFPDLSIDSSHYERAAEFYNICRSHGIQCSNTDILICAAADLNQLPIFTADKDFEHLQKYLPVTLYSA